MNCVACAEAKKLFQAPDAPKTVMEALMQRLEKYKSSEDSAKQAGDSSKARRMGRIVKVVFVPGLFFCLDIGLLLLPLVFFISCLSFCF